MWRITAMKINNGNHSRDDVKIMASQRTQQELWHIFAKFMFSKDIKSINQTSFM